MALIHPEHPGDPITNEEMLCVAESFLSAYKSRDWELLKSILTEDCIWRLPGSSRIAGVALGTEEIIKRAQQLSRYGVHIHLIHIFYGINGFTLSLHNQASRDQVELDEYQTTVFNLRDYNISGLNTFLLDVESVDRFFNS